VELELTPADPIRERVVVVYKHATMNIVYIFDWLHGTAPYLYLVCFPDVFITYWQGQSVVHARYKFSRNESSEYITLKLYFSQLATP